MSTRTLALMTGGLLIGIGIVLATLIAWDNPDMTNRRLLIDYPGPVLGSLLSVVVGGYAVCKALEMPR